MKKIILLIPLMLLSIFENNNCMHRKMFKKSYQRQGHVSRRCGPKKVRPRTRKRTVARDAKREVRQQEESFYREPRPKVSLAELRRSKNESCVSSVSESLPKSSRVSSSAPSIDFSFENTDLVSKILLFYVVFCQILSSQHCYCYSWEEEDYTFQGSWKSSFQQSSESLSNKIEAINAASRQERMSFTHGHDTGQKQFEEHQKWHNDAMKRWDERNKAPIDLTSKTDNQRAYDFGASDRLEAARMVPAVTEMVQNQQKAEGIREKVWTRIFNKIASYLNPYKNEEY